MRGPTVLTRADRRALYDSPCGICGEGGDIEIDHIVPRKHGGQYRRDNIQPLCRVCNAIKRDRRNNQQVALWIGRNLAAFREKKLRRANHLLLYYNR